MFIVDQWRGTIYENGGGMVAQKVMRDRDLTPESKAIYGYLCSYAWGKPGEERTAFPEVEQIWKELNMSESRYYRHLEPLKKKGYITIEQKRKSGAKFDKNTFVINAIPVPSEPSPQNEGADEKPSPQNGGTQNGGTQNVGTNKDNIPNKDKTNNKKDIKKDQDQDQREQKEKVEVPVNHHNDLDNLIHQEKSNAVYNMLQELNDIDIPFNIKNKIRLYISSLKEKARIDYDLRVIEKVYHTNRFINPDATDEDYHLLNDQEFEKVVMDLFKKGESPRNFESQLNHFVRRKVDFKYEDYEARKPKIPFYNWLEN